MEFKRPVFKEIKLSGDLIPIEHDVSDLDTIDSIHYNVSQLQDYKEITVDEAITLESEEEIKKLEKDLIDLNSIMKDLNQLVFDQGILINEAEENIDETQLNTEVAVEELQKAEGFQISKRRKIVGATAGATIGGVLLGGLGCLLGGAIPGAIGGGIGTAGGAIGGVVLD